MVSPKATTRAQERPYEIYLQRALVRPEQLRFQRARLRLAGWLRGGLCWIGIVGIVNPRVVMSGINT